MPTIFGTAGNDTWKVVSGGTYVVDGLAGVDTLNLGTSTRSDYTIKQLADGAIQIDSVSGASSSFHATLYNFEKLVFNNDRDTLDLLAAFPTGINGTANDDILSGTAANDKINGLAGNDTITGNAGNDTIDGGIGTDSAVFSGKLSNYTITHSGTSYSIKAKTGTDGTDTVTNIESLKFSDMTVNLDVHAVVASAPSANVQSIIELYVAFFRRVPDADGLVYWIQQMKAGQSINQIAESFYNAGLLFPALTGFDAKMGNAEFVNLIYKNVLGRTDGADPEGLAYWTEQLSTGKATKGKLVTDILFAAHGFKGDATFGWVADLLDNRIAVAKTFAIDLGLGYVTPDDSILHGMEITAAVTPTNTATAISLIGIVPADIILI